MLVCVFFRIFVGTWNVAGRSPVGSLAVDLDEWLNLKNSADIYVLGYVSIYFKIIANVYVSVLYMSNIFCTYHSTVRFMNNLVN